ncbi:MAG: response regulator [Pseudomonadota bacterium]
MPKKILVIDDEPELIKAIEIRLQVAGFETLSASDGMEGLEKAREEKPDLIILDVMLPNMDGYQVCTLLKRDDQYKGIPIIILTARTQLTDEKRARECGADIFVTKPFQHEELVAKVREFLKE